MLVDMDTSKQAPPEALNIASFRKVLVLIPHPDDESIGCGGLIAMLARQGTPVHVLLVSDGSGAGGLPEGAAATRQNELMSALKVLGENVTSQCGRLPDGHLSQTSQLEPVLQRSIEQCAPTLVLAPWLKDIHPDHAAVGRAACHLQQQSEACWDLLFYEVWTPLPASHILNITEAWPQKLAALQCHKTALQCGNYVRAMASLAAYRSLLSGRLAADGEFAEAYLSRKGVKRNPDTPLGGGEGCYARYVTPDDAEPLRQLFAEVFGQEPDQHWWHNKYIDQPQAGTLGVSESGDVIAFYGAMHRLGCWKGVSVHSAQQADVMVAPEHRFATRGQGVFSHVSRLFLQEQLGAGRPYQMAYGFPTARALRLGVILGLYRQADPLVYWLYTNVKNPLGLGWQVRTTPCQQVRDWQFVDTLQPFTADPERYFWLEKSGDYWQQRFVRSRPLGKQYQMLRLYRWGRLSGVAILALLPGESDSLEILDLALTGNHPDSAQKLVAAIANYGLRQRVTRTSAWGTQQAIDELRRHADSLQHTGDSDVHHAGYMALPSDHLDAPLTKAIAGQCWMLGGDTDFR